jgi:Ni/Co efflux regulator RcnB
LTENFAVFGYHVTGSTGTLFLSGIVIGAAAMLGLSMFAAGTRRTASHRRNARRGLKRSQREAAFVNRDRDARPEHPSVAATGSAVNPAVATTHQKKHSLFGRWSRGRRQSATVRAGGQH